MYSAEEQAMIRLDIFHWLELQMQDQVTISKDDLLTGYSFRGDSIPLLDRYKGIHNPKVLDETLSVVSTLKSKYVDAETPDGMILYDYQSTGDDYGNKKLRKAFENQTPIIYLREIEKGKYLPFINVYVIGDDTSLKKFILDFRNAGESDLISFGVPAVRPSTEIEKKYALIQTKRRVHQPAFRAAVISAYAEKCAICDLQHASLLDAAHILPDSHELGKPVVPNGLSLCKIHHAAYDKKILGISPEYMVKISNPILKEIDGPMLKHGIQEMDGRKISIPKAEKDRPNPEYLAIKFKEFLELSK